jgi:peptidoglycan hydrolase-like protein with peptidoglycan-binding domain
MAVWPNGSRTTRPRVSSAYGYRTGGAFSFHYGADCTGYTELKAVLGGKVTFAGWLNDAAGYSIAIDSVDGGQSVTIVRMHAESISVRRGDTVVEGQTIGLMGSTGNATGDCDHVEIRFWTAGKMTTVDPIPWIAARIAPPAPAALSVGRNLTKRPTKDIQRLVGAIPDGVYGPATTAKVKSWQKANGLTADGIWGPKSDAKGFPVKKSTAKPTAYPKVSIANVSRIGDVRGLQKIARLGGYRGAIDNKWGPGSQSGFALWLRSAGYKSVSDWLRKRWGYVGDDTLGPKMTAALRRANTENFKAL